MHGIIVMSGKGGVGKTTVAINLAKTLAEHNKVGLLDADLAAPNVPVMLDIDEEARIGVSDGLYRFYDYQKNLSVFSMGFIIPSGISMSLNGNKRASIIREFFSNLDFGIDMEYLVVDFPPGSGDESIAVIESLVGLTDSIGAIIVATGKRESVEDAKRVIAMLKDIPYDVPVIGAIQNMAYLKRGSNKVPLFDDLLDIGGELGCEVIATLPYKNPLAIRDFNAIKKQVEAFFNEEEKNG